MKIALISPAHPLRGGIAASSERLALALQETGHEVVIFSYSLQYPSFLFPGKTQLTADPTPAQLTIRTIINSINPFNWIAAARTIASFQPDQVVVRFWMPFFGPCLGTILRAIRWFSSRKSRVTALVDNMIPHEKRPGDRWLSNYFIRACDDFVVMSESVGQDIRSFLLADTTADRVRFFPHPIYDIYGERIPRSTARQQLNIPESAPVVLFFGLIRAYKGLDLLLKALDSPANAQVHAIIAGECYEDWAVYQQIIDAHQLNDRVHLFLDYIPNEAVTQYFSAADVLVQPYKTATQSGVLQVGYQFDMPVIVTRVGGLPEMVAENVSGITVPPDDPGALSAAIAAFFKSQTDWTSGVKAYKKRFDWSGLVKTLLQPLTGR